MQRQWQRQATGHLGGGGSAEAISGPHTGSVGEGRCRDEWLGDTDGNYLQSSTKREPAPGAPVAT